MLTQLKKWWNLYKPASIASHASPASNASPAVTLQDVLAQYSVVSVVPSGEDHGPFVVVTERNAETSTVNGISFEPDTVPDGIHSYYGNTIAGGGAPSVVPLLESSANENGSQQTYSTQPYLFAERPDVKEIGSTNPTTAFAGRGEYNRQLEDELGFDKYNRARLSDGIIAGVLLAIKTPVFAGNWRVDPEDDEPQMREAAEFVQKCLMDYQSISWTQILIDAMLCADYGFMIFEKVWEIRKIGGKRRAVLKKLAPRHPSDVTKISYDKNGGPSKVTFSVVEESGDSKEVEINISKLLIITYNQEISNVRGRSVLRSAYQHYFYKTQLYKIDAIQKERHGIGIPVIKLPPGFTAQDKIEANALGRNLRTNERAHIILPPNWDLYFAKLEGNPVNAMESIEYHDQAIRESVLAGFLGNAKSTKDEDLGLFLKATRFIANSICDSFNNYLIPDLVKFNFKDSEGVGMPKLKVRQIGEQADNRTMSFTLRNMVGAGLIRPDDVLENYLRDLFDLPPVDLATVRVVKAPGAQVTPPTTPNATPGTQTQLPDGNGNDSNKPNGNDSGQPAVPGTKGPFGLPRQTALPNIGVGGNGIGGGKGQR